MQRMQARAAGAQAGATASPPVQGTAAHPIELDSSPGPSPFSASIRSHPPSSDEYSSLFADPFAAGPGTQVQRTPQQTAAQRLGAGSGAGSHAVLNLTGALLPAHGQCMPVPRRCPPASRVAYTTAPSRHQTGASGPARAVAARGRARVRDHAAMCPQLVRRCSCPRGTLMAQQVAALQSVATDGGRWSS